MEVNQTEQLTATVNPADTTEKVQWTSSNTDVATVNDTGLVTAKASGTATITVKNANGTKSATCEINVIDGYLVGYGSTETSGYGHLAKIDGNGKILWQKEKLFYYSINAITKMSDGNYLVGYGSTETSGYGHLAKIDGNGNILWQKEKLFYYSINAITQMPDGNYLVGYGSTETSGYGHLAKIDGNGNILWQKEKLFYYSINAITD